MGTYGKRIGLFIFTNLAVVVLLGVVLRLLGIDSIYQAGGVDLDYQALLVFSLVVGFAGSLISLALSKTMARASTGARVIRQPSNETETWLLETVRRLSERARIGMPDVAIFPAPEPNAFATGARRDRALVAVSEGLLRSMNKREIEAVLGHEIAHVANGDMVTMALLQGVLNTFVVFLARIIGHFVDRNLLRDEEDTGGGGIGYFVVTIVAELCLGFLASLIAMWFSRQREFRADAGAATLTSREAMTDALRALQRAHNPSEMPQQLAAFGIRGRKREGLARLLLSHPPLEARIAALQKSRF